MRAGHEAAVAAASVDSPSDPLAPSAAYVKWAVGAYPPRSPALLSVLEGACRRFQDDARYANDARFVRFWVRYADARDDALEVFGFMGERGIGSEIGLYYEALATTLEYKRDFERADKVFREGVAKGAKPLVRLQSRYDDFLGRMTARAVREEKRAARAARDKRKVGGASSGSRSGLAARPSDENERPALGKLTSREARTGLRPVLAPTNGHSSGLGMQKGGAGDENADTSFKVFADPVAVGGGSGSGDGGGGGEAKGPTVLSSFDQVRKENEGELPVKMAGATLKQNKGMVKARARAGLRQRPDGGGGGGFQIYAGPPSADAAGGGGDVTRGGRLDLATKREKWTPAGPVGPPSARPARPAPTSPTINTKIAMQEVEDMFNTSLPFERGDTSRENGRESDPFPDAEPLPAIKTEVPAFEIFCDADAAPEPPLEKTGVGGERPKDASMDAAAAWPVDASMPERQLSRGASSAMSVVDEVDVSAPSVATAMPLRRAGSAKEVDRQIGEWCFESAAYLMGYECCADGDIKMESGNLVELKGEGGEVRTFFVESIIGSGPEKRSAKLQSTVYSAALIDAAAMADEDEDELVVAIKASGTVFLLWEFYIYSMISTRIAVSSDPRVRGLDCISKALFFYHAEPLSFLITDRVSVATIAHVSDLAVEVESCDITEPITMFFVIDLLRAVEVLHSVGVIHADITLQNVILRKGGSEAWSGPYNAAGQNGWRQKGIALIDFNHSVDTQHEAVGGLTARDISLHTAFLGDAHMEPANKSGEGEAWGFNADCRAIANFARSLLNVSKDRRSSTKAMWQDITDKLLGVTSEALGESTSAVMRECRSELDDALVSRCEADGGAKLRGDLKSLIVAAREASLAGDVTC